VGLSGVGLEQSAAAVQTILMAFNHLQPQHVPALAEQLRKFPALKQLDVSRNLRLGCVDAAAVLSALSGMLHTGALSFLSLRFEVTSMCRGWCSWS
jgi:hypothetical protein